MVEPAAQMPDVQLRIDTKFGTDIRNETANTPAVEILDQTGVSRSPITNLPATAVEIPAATTVKTLESMKTLEPQKLEGAEQFNGQ